MQIPVLIEPIAGNGYRAKSGAPLVLSAEGATRDEALRKLRDLMDSQLQRGTQLVPFDFPVEDHPWLAKGRIFDPNDPLVQEWIKIMATNRRKMDEDPDEP